MPSYDDQTKKTFPSEISCVGLTKESPNLALEDHKSNEGRCAASFLLATENKTNPSWNEVLQSMSAHLDSISVDQQPVLQSSRPLSVDNPLNIVLPKSRGTKRALLIGINYTGQSEALRLSHDNVMRMKEYLVDRQGFDSNQITLLMDMKNHPYYPTRKNILTSFRKLVRESNVDDVIFIYFAGRSGRILDTTRKPSNDRYVETLLPIDYETAGVIIADEIYDTLLRAANVRRLTLVMDCCRGGSIIQLPYVYNATNDYQMHYTDGFDFDALIGLALVGGVLIGLGSSSTGNDVGGGGVGGGGGTTSAADAGDARGSSTASNSDNEDCCGGCCEALIEGLFD